jgi:GT2 family glycosyltransferase
VDVSIIIVNYKGRELLDDCFRSLPESTRRSWEVLFVDNGSQDGSVEYVEQAHPKAILVRNTKNLGFAAAVNQGRSLAQGNYILLLNTDARLGKGSLDLLIDAMEARPECGIAAPQLVHADGTLQHSFDTDPTLATTFLNKSLLRRLFPGLHPSLRQSMQEPWEVENVIGASMLIRAETFLAVGAFDEDFFLFLEETDFCRRARQSEWKVLMVPEARVVHLQGRSKQKVAVRARIEYVRSLFTYFRKYHPFSYWVVRILYPCKNITEVIGLTLGNLFTLFSVPRLRSEGRELLAVLVWQLLFCPKSMGLSRG